MRAAEMKERPGFSLMKQTDVQTIYHMQMPRWLFYLDHFRIGGATLPRSRVRARLRLLDVMILRDAERKLRANLDREVKNSTAYTMATIFNCIAESESDLMVDPELRHTPAGVPVASFSIACDRDYKDKATGERGVDFIDIVAWRSTGEFVSKYFAKGRMAVVSGRLQMRDWTDKEGNKRRSAEIIADNVYFGDSKSKEDQEPPASTGGPVETAGGDSFGLPDNFSPNFGEPADDGSLPF